MMDRDLRAPVDAMLRDAQGFARFHMPGHKGRLDPLDMTEIARTDDLYAPQAGIAEAERMAAISCGAAHTLMLTGGATAGILAMILERVPPGGKLLLARNAHHAALSACVWGGVDAVFTDDLPAAIRENPDARAVLVTRPDYYGACMNLAPVVQAAHARGMRVLVDEAHGAHFPWWEAPQSAGRLGADAWVQSAHKTLPALTGAAFLHLSGSVDAARARRFLRMVQTSSPPFLILRSLDNARAWMDAHGARALEDLLGLLAEFRARLGGLSGYTDASADDPTRLVIDTRGRGLSGLDAQARLAERGVDVEMADDARVVCICTVCDRAEDFDRLYNALSAIPQGEPLPPVPPLGTTPPGPRALSVRDAALAPQEAVPLADAVGRVASVPAGMYPPGVPLVLPGETITETCVNRLLSLPGDRRFGVENDSLICVK